MEFSEKMKELVKSGATINEVASAFGLDVSSLPQEWSLFFTNMIMFSCSQQLLLENMNSNISSMKDQVSALTSAVTCLQSEIRERNSKNSSNSSKPPSSDGYSKPSINKKTSLREPSGKKPGAQKGHIGKGLKKVMADESITHNHYPLQCTKCENFASCVSLMKCISKGHIYETKTVIIDNEHKVYSIVCPMMGKLIIGEKPNDLKSSQQYGVSIKEFVVSLWTTGVTSLNRLQKLVSKHLGLDVSEGTISKIVMDFAIECGKLVDVVKEYLKNCHIKGADETGLRAGGSLHWLHVVCDKKATYLYADKKRGFDAISSESGILIDSLGTLIHDCWSPYFKLSDIEHAICLQHIQRELRAAAIREKDDAEYFKDMENLLLDMRKAKLDAIEQGKTYLDKDVINDFRSKLRAMIDEGLQRFKPPKRCRLKLGKIPEGKTRRLLLRLKDHEDSIFKFIEDFDVEYSNNESERSLRSSKVRQAVSKCFRKLEGMKQFASITTILDTARKNNIDHPLIIKAVFNGTARSLLSSALA